MSPTPTIDRRTTIRSAGAAAVGHRVGAGAVAGRVDRFTTAAGVLLVVAGVGQAAYALGVV